MSRTYGTVITNAGAGIIADCILSGGRVAISQAAAGDGGGAYYEPSADQNALVNECWRGEIAAAKINADNPNMLDIKIVIPDDAGGFVVREVGLFDADGNMIAVCNTPDTEKPDSGDGVTGRLTMLMHIVVADASVVEFIINSTLDAISQEELDAAIGAHNASPNSHADIRVLALNSVQHGEVYTKPETDSIVSEAVREHNTGQSAHAGIVTSLSALDTRLAMLELKYGTNVTGNAFAVDFDTLDGLIVTGVWNEELARIEF